MAPIVEVVGESVAGGAEVVATCDVVGEVGEAAVDDGALEVAASSDEQAAATMMVAARTIGNLRMERPYESGRSKRHRPQIMSYSTH